MDQKLPEEGLIRQYLLGELDEPELSEIEQKLLSSEELSQTADLLEDEIIDQYLDGDLDERDKRAVETHFLRPPGHQEKLRFARLLRQHFELLPDRASDVLDRVPPMPPPAVLRYRFLWTYGGAAAAVLLGALSLYLSVAQSTLKKELTDSQKAQAVIQADLTQERERSAGLAKNLQALQTSSLVTLELLPGVVRSGGVTVPRATIQPATLFMRVDVLLRNTSSGSFRAVLLDHQGREILSQSGLRSLPATPLARLVFDVPVHGIRAGQYDVVVIPQPNQGSPERYPLDIDVAQ